jgi:flagellar basal-body rod protein FlgC
MQMNLLGLLDVSGSALEAERIRAEVVAANMANANTTRTASGGPYLRKEVVFASQAPEPGAFASQFAGQFAGGAEAPVSMQAMAGGMAEPQVGGVRVSAVLTDKNAILRRYDPSHPDADKQGYVSYPDINPVTEMVDLMSATRSYGLNSSAVQATKNMINSALDILKA